MSTTTSNETVGESDDRTYGNWQRPPRGGLLNLGNTGTIAGAVVLVIAVLTLMVGGLLAGLIVGVVGESIVALFSLQNRDGRSTFDRINVRWMFHRAKASGDTVHRAALTPTGITTLPGLLAKTTVSEHLDPFGHPFAMITWPGEYYTVAWSSSPDGAAGADNADVDTMVAYYGEWLAGQASQSGLIGSSVIIETAPDTGGALSRHIAETGRPTASALSKAVMSEIARTYPEGSAEHRAYVTMTFQSRGRIPKIRNKSERAQAMANSLAADLHDMVAALAHSGAGALTPMDVQTLCEQVRIAYDPAVAANVDEARAQGVSVEAMTWTTAGPMAYQNEWGYLVHDSGASVTYGMTVPPRSNITANVLSKLVAPANFARKRVALIYQILPQEKAGLAAESGVSNAVFARNASKAKTARLNNAVRSAELTAAEEAKGASIGDITVVATATVLDQTKIEQIATSLNNLAGTAKLRMRRLYGGQDAYFALTLPLGMQIDRHVPGPKIMKMMRGEV